MESLPAPEMPELVEAVLNEEQLQQLFRDLTQHAEELSVLEKGAPQVYASPQAVPLAEAAERLANGITRGLQLRYRYDGSEWTDTLLRVPQGVRLVRCKHR